MTRRRRWLWLPVGLAIAGCSTRAAYEVAWTIEAVRLEDGVRRPVASHDGPGLPPEWVNGGGAVRVLETVPASPHDTLGFLYWRHVEAPLAVKAEDADCEIVSKPGSVITTRQCAGKVFTVKAHCGKGCRRDVARAVADSLGADAIIVADETLDYRGRLGEPSEVPESAALSNGFPATYVMIVWTRRETSGRNFNRRGETGTQ